MDTLFQALASAPRRRMLDLVKDRPGITVGAVCEQFEMSRIGVIKHLRVLEDAQLLLSEKKGRSRHLHFNVVPIQQVYDRWTTDYSELWASRLTQLKYTLENRPEDEE
ncbi:MAG: transcriptional regulator [Acidobacteriota bacterium]